MMHLNAKLTRADVGNILRRMLGRANFKISQYRCQNDVTHIVHVPVNMYTDTYRGVFVKYRSN